jgi:alkanesulfonate monooxygenase SsuD/methylene tetrahydromethanopterin reductase-like flavin-dependent oxidoreductase (luciferase family)
MRAPALGIFLSQTTDRDNIAQARLAEAVGLDAIWLSDVLAGPVRFEAVSLCALLLGATERIRAGVNVVNTTTWYPQTLARLAATLDAASGGRFLLGLGAGYRPFFETQRAWGYPLPRGRARLEYFREVLEYLHAYFGGGQMTYSGEHIRAAGVEGSPLVPGRRPPFYIGGTGPTVMRLAARYADRWDGVGGWRRDEKGEFEPFLAAQVDAFRAACDEAGRPPGDVELSVTVYAAIERTRERAEALLARADLAVDNRPPVVGTPDDLAQFLVRIARYGVAEFQVFPVGLRVLALTDEDHAWQIRAIGEEVRPALRGS